MSAPALICCSHGTASPEGRATVSALVAAAGDALGVETHETYVDVQHPQIDEVVASVNRPAVIVPLLLSPGFHTSVDIGRAAASRPDVTATRTLGPDPLLASSLAERVEAIGLQDDDFVVLAASGSSRPEAALSVEEVRTALEARLGAPVAAGYAYGATPKVAEAVGAARAAGAGRVIVASYVLAPGHFAARIATAGADVVTEPLGLVPGTSAAPAADPRMVGIIMERFREGCRSLRVAVSGAQA